MSHLRQQSGDTVAGLYALAGWLGIVKSCKAALNLTPQDKRLPPASTLFSIRRVSRSCVPLPSTNSAQFPGCGGWRKVSIAGRLCGHAISLCGMHTHRRSMQESRQARWSLGRGKALLDVVYVKNGPLFSHSHGFVAPKSTSYLPAHGALADRPPTSGPSAKSRQSSRFL